MSHRERKEPRAGGDGTRLEGHRASRTQQDGYHGACETSEKEEQSEDNYCLAKITHQDNPMTLPLQKKKKYPKPKEVNRKDVG